MDAARALTDLKGFIGASQLHAIDQVCRGEERQFFYDKLVVLARIVADMPKTYEQDGLEDTAVVHLHYFLGSMNWWITGKDMETEQHQAFGLVDLGHGAELGYISIVEIVKAGVQLDMYWQPQTLQQIKAKQTA